MKSAKKTKIGNKRTTKIRELSTIETESKRAQDKLSGGLLGNSGVGKTCFTSVGGYKTK